MDMIANGIRSHEAHEKPGARSPEPANSRVRAAAYVDAVRKQVTVAADFARQAAAEIRKRPVLATATAGTLGLVLGGVVFPSWGRLAFVGTMGYFANEVWRREGRIQVDQLVAALGMTADPSDTTSPSEGRD
ncbi:MAG TPA: hypothetical protein VK841_07280 [Polyangiaceae bacterium]|jgi:hypothetical protein|nr:hypothetical protein [Polyangiaceae bacterium]